MMAAKNGSHDAWGDLSHTIQELPHSVRERILAAVRVLAHDLREANGQIRSAEELLRRSLPTADQPSKVEEWVELLDVIHSASDRINRLLAASLHRLFENQDGRPVDQP